MKAVLLTKLGGVDALVYNSVNKPQLRQNQALVKVHYCGVNHLDILIRQGKRPGPKKFPHILGSEIVGEVISLNGEAENIQVGDRAVVYPWIFDDSCQLCKQGQENICDHGGTIGRTDWGGYGEYVVVPTKNLIKLPRGIKEEVVCAVTLAGATAVHLVERAGVVDKSVVLLTGATGGVGTIVLQLLKHRRCTIICATSHQSKMEKLKKISATYVVLTKNLAYDVLQLMPQGVDYAIDIVGGKVWSVAVETLKKNGTIAFCSTSVEEPGEVDLAKAFHKQLNILGSYGGTRANLQTVLNLVKKGIVSPVIDSIIPLSQAREAHLKMERQELFGKVLLKVC